MKDNNVFLHLLSYSASSFLLFVSLLLFASPVLAANTGQLSLIPSTGNYHIGSPISVTLQASSSNPFNVIGANVGLTNLHVQSITPGTCNLTYVHSPSASNPSFTGAIFQTSSTNCSVYTLLLMPIQNGPASINLSSPQLVDFATSRPLSVSTNGANFTIGTSSSQGKLTFSPVSGSYNLGSLINVTLQATSATPFNVVGATVGLTNLSVHSITPGTCNLTYIHAPTTTNLSFTGAIFQGSSTNCSVYKLFLVPSQKGPASIQISSPQLVAYATSQQLSVVTNSPSYTITTLTPPHNSTCSSFINCLNLFLSNLLHL